MSWQVSRQHVDKALGHDIIHLHEPQSGAEHIIQIIVGHQSCPVCGHVRPKTDLGDIDRHAIIAQEIANLELSHANAEAWARKHRIPILGKDGKAR